MCSSSWDSEAGSGEVVQSEEQHYRKRISEHSEHYISGSCGPFSIVTMLLFMVYTWQCIFHINLWCLSQLHVCFFPQILHIQTCFLLTATFCKLWGFFLAPGKKSSSLHFSPRCASVDSPLCLKRCWLSAGWQVVCEEGESWVTSHSCGKVSRAPGASESFSCMWPVFLLWPLC